MAAVGHGLSLGDLGEEIRVDEFDVDDGTNDTDPVADASFGHRRTIHHSTGAPDCFHSAMASSANRPASMSTPSS